jgi:hypothetical protein
VSAAIQSPNIRKNLATLILSFSVFFCTFCTLTFNFCNFLSLDFCSFYTFLSFLSFKRPERHKKSRVSFLDEINLTQFWHQLALRPIPFQQVARLFIHRSVLYIFSHGIGFGPLTGNNGSNGFGDRWRQGVRFQPLRASVAGGAPR